MSSDSSKASETASNLKACSSFCPQEESICFCKGAHHTRKLMMKIHIIFFIYHQRNKLFRFGIQFFNNFLHFQNFLLIREDFYFCSNERTDEKKMKSCSDYKFCISDFLYKSLEICFPIKGC